MIKLYVKPMNSLVWIELDAHAPNYNLNELGRGIKGTLLCAVVKANAYGHGITEIVGLLSRADWFAVSSLEEGIELRGLGVKKPILLLGYVPLKRLDEAIINDLRITLYNRETLEALKNPDIERLITGKSSRRKNAFPVHIKIETGTGRQGIMPEGVEEYIELLGSIRSLTLEGVCTHFANADAKDQDYTRFQLKRFRKVLNTIKASGIDPPVIHTANTAASILLPEAHFNMIRLGIGLYGLWPSRETQLSTQLNGRPVPDLKPVLTWKTRVVQIKRLPKGSFVSYGCTYKTSRATKLAVLPVGYADGYDRALGNKSYVLVRGKRAPVIGRVCMNLTMIDISDIQGVKLEDEVVLLGKDGHEEISAETISAWAGTINYEIVTRISPLLERKVIPEK